MSRSAVAEHAHHAVADREAAPAQENGLQYNPFTQPEAIPGLASAVERERRAVAALEGVLTRRAVCRRGVEEAIDYKAALVDRAADGDVVEPRELVAAQMAIDEAETALATFPEVIDAAEGTLEHASNAVTLILGSEMTRRRDVAQQRLADAERALEAAASVRARAQDALRQATGAAAQNDRALRMFLASEIAAVSECSD